MEFFKSLFSKYSKDMSSQDLSSLAFLQSPVAMLLTDDKGTILNINHSFTELMGYTKTDVIGERMSLMKSGEYNNAFYKSFYNNLNTTEKHNLEIYNRCKDGQLMLMNEQIVHISSNGHKYFIVTLEDITEQKKCSERYQYLATHDPLTGLANRMLLEDRFDHAILNATRSAKKLAILMCDLNEFKKLNDRYGHNFGDLVLQTVAKKLKDSVRINDTIARYGGDEFILILEQIEDIDEVKNVVNVLNSVFPMPLEINNEVCEIGMSIGYSCFPEEGTTFNQLTDQADAKMYVEKDRYYGML